MPTVSQMLISSTWAHPFQTCPVEVTRGTQLGRLGPALLCCQPLVRSDECTEKIEKPSDCTDRFLDPSITISSFAVYPCRTFGTNQDFKLPDVQTTTVNLNSLKRGQIYYLYLSFEVCCSLRPSALWTQTQWHVLCSIYIACMWRSKGHKNRSGKGPANLQFRLIVPKSAIIS